MAQLWAGSLHGLGGWVYGGVGRTERRRLRRTGARRTGARGGGRAVARSAVEAHLAVFRNTRQDLDATWTTSKSLSAEGGG